MRRQTTEAAARTATPPTDTPPADASAMSATSATARARLLLPFAALWWGLQFAFLNPALALLLTGSFGADAAQVGIALAAYNASGFLTSLLLPAWADRRGNYLHPLWICGVLSVALAAVLIGARALPAPGDYAVAVAALVLLGGPASTGMTLLFAHLRSTGAGVRQVANTRALVSFAWVIGPLLATALVSWSGDVAVLAGIAVVAACGCLTTLAVLRARPRPPARPASSPPQQGQTPSLTATSSTAASEVTPTAAASSSAVKGAPPVATGSEPPADVPVDAPRDGPADQLGLRRGAIAVVVLAFVALQATNSAAVSVMALFVSDTLDADVVWSGAVLGVAAALEIPALVLIGRLSGRIPDLVLLASGCVAGLAYYAGAAAVTSPVALLALQLLNAWFFAAVAGVGLVLFQRVIARPGLASGLYTNTRRLGAIAAGPLLALGATGAWGYRATFAACAVLTALALICLAAVILRPGRPARPGATG